MTKTSTFISAIFVYLAGTTVDAKHNKFGSICTPYRKPAHHELEMTARWLVHSLNWGVVSTISTRNTTFPSPLPFGNVLSFVDGSCTNSTGTPYFYGTDMDQTYIDLKENPVMSFTLSEEGLGGVNYWQVANSCQALPGLYGDPETPPCARLTMTGEFQRLEEGSEEEEFVKAAMFDRHPAMKRWPKGHEFYLGKLVVKDLWLLDWFGGAPKMDLGKYFELDLEPGWMREDSKGPEASWQSLNELLNVFTWLL